MLLISFKWKCFGRWFDIFVELIEWVKVITTFPLKNASIGVLREHQNTLYPLRDGSSVAQNVRCQILLNTQDSWNFVNFITTSWLGVVIEFIEIKMDLIIANVDHIEFKIERDLNEQFGALPLPFPGMDSESLVMFTSQYNSWINWNNLFRIISCHYP